MIPERHSILINAKRMLARHGPARQGHNKEKKNPSIKITRRKNDNKKVEQSGERGPET